MQFLRNDHHCAGWKGEMSERIRTFNWAATDIGPIQLWPKSLRATVQVLLASPVPIVLLWGPAGHMIYNDAYSAFAGGRHPFLLGQPVELGWPEVAAFNRHVLRTGLAGGTLSFRDKELVLLRNGRPEDVWMDLSYSPVPDDDGAPAGVIAIVTETTLRVIAERRREEAELAYRATNERLQLALNTGAVLGSFVWDIKANILAGDERFARTFSYPIEHAERGLPIEAATKIVHPDDLDRVNALIRRTVELGEPYRAEYRVRRPDGSYTWILASGLCEFDANRQPYRFPGVLLDIHERKMAEEALLQLTLTLEQRVTTAIAAKSQAEEQLRQSQKLEAIGALTGGIAHDFNNVLHVISGNLQLLTMQERENQKVKRRVDAATAAVQRGAKLSAQLLAFARRQPLSPAVISPRRIFDGLEELLQRALGETITLIMNLPDDTWHIQVDKNQMENALLNLAINARDALHGEGIIHVAGHNIVLDANEVAGKDIAAGDYVHLSISDKGVGMTAEVLSHAFEPFFTTKPDGHGTGLGLSMVFGFVKQSGGHIDMQSTPGVGTSVNMYFPRSVQDEVDQTESQVERPAGGDETILVVEDDDAVRETVIDTLRQLGYAVEQADNGDMALAMLQGGTAVDLVFTDVVMPGRIKSADLAAWAKTQIPAIPVIFTSGHIRDVISRNSLVPADVHLLSKPYEPAALAAMIRKVLTYRTRRPHA